MRWWEELQGPLLGRYRVEKLLGQGGMAEVLLARDERFEGKRVAIKAPTLDSFAPNQLAELLLRFRREVQRQGSESIAGVVPIFDAGEVTDSRGNSQPFLVMDYLSGGSLGDALGGSSGRRERTQTLGEVLEWLKPVATTLDRLHARKYLHRDVKPDNILFNADGDPFLSDFGIATSLDDVASAATMMSVMGSAGPGSPGYQSPESLRGEKLAASDQFSLAATAYEALAGRLPMHATTRDAWIGALANWKPTPLSELCPELPVAATEVLMRALSVEPRDRYLSCSAFAQAFADAVHAPAFATPAPVEAPPAPRPAPVGAAAAKPELASNTARPSRWRKLPLYGAVVLLLLTAGVIALGRWLDSGEDVFDTIQDKQAAALADAGSAPAGVASASTAAVAPDGTIVGDMDGNTLIAAVRATQKLERAFNEAAAVAAIDAENASVRVAGDDARRKAMASSLEAAKKGRDAVNMAANLAEFAGSWMDIADEKGGELLSYATDIVVRAKRSAEESPYAERKLSELSPQLPLDPSFALIAREITAAEKRIDAVNAEHAGREPPAAHPDELELFRRQLAEGSRFTLEFDEVRPFGIAPAISADRCHVEQTLFGTEPVKAGVLETSFFSVCDRTDRNFTLRDQYTLNKAFASDSIFFHSAPTTTACKHNDGSDCVDIGPETPRPARGSFDLVTKDLLVVRLGFDDGTDTFYILTRSGARGGDELPFEDAARAASP